MLSEANTTISALQEQLGSLNRSTGGVKETASSRLQDSTGQLQVIPPVNSYESAAEKQTF